MGNQESTEINISEEKGLIDFLYIDKGKVDSFLSQIQKGALRSVKKTNDITRGSSFSGEGGIPTVAKGVINKSNNDKNALEEQYDPYHSQLLELLDFLDLPLFTTVPQDYNAKIVLLETHVSIRNLDTIKKTIPLFKNNKKLLGISPSEFKAMDATMKLVEDLLGLMPLSIDLELTFESGEIINGPLKESGLSIKSDDLFRSYGTQLPGTWYTLGILDKRIKPIPSAANQSLNSMIDLIASSMSDLYVRSPLQISPILIFRSAST